MSLPPLVEHPTATEPPADVLRQLREVDPTAELLYLGAGSWVVGRVRTGRPRQDAALKILRSAIADAEARKLDEAAWYQRIRYARAVRQGFAPIALYQFQGLPDGRVVKEFREAVWWSEHDRGGHEARRREDGGKEARVRAARADLTDPARHREAARIMRAPVSIISPGLPAQRAS